MNQIYLMVGVLGAEKELEVLELLIHCPAGKNRCCSQRSHKKMFQLIQNYLERDYYWKNLKTNFS